MAIEALSDLTRNSVSAFAAGGASGWTTIDFGVNGSDRASTFIFDQDAISVDSFVSVGLRGMPSADHTYEEHIVEQMDVRTGNLVNGVGFEIYGVTRNVKLYGSYNVFWKWE